jgi:hypothetical protein
MGNFNSRDFFCYCEQGCDLQCDLKGGDMRKEVHEAFHILSRRTTTSLQCP